MNSFNISARRIAVRRATGMDRRATLITLGLCAVVFVAFYAIGHKQATPTISREVAPLQLPIVATATAVPSRLSDAPALAPAPAVARASPAPVNVPGTAAARVPAPVIAPAVAAPAPATPLVRSAPAPTSPQRSTSTPSPTHGGGASGGGGGGSHHEGGGTSFDSSG